MPDRWWLAFWHALVERLREALDPEVVTDALLGFLAVLLLAAAIFVGFVLLIASLNAVMPWLVR